MTLIIIWYLTTLTSGMRQLTRSSLIQIRHRTWTSHDDVIKWKHFPRYWPFVRGIHRSPVTSPHKGQWRGTLMFSLICARINCWVNHREAGDLRRNRAHYDVIVMVLVHYLRPWRSLIFSSTLDDFLSVSNIVEEAFVRYLVTNLVTKRVLMKISD